MMIGVEDVSVNFEWNKPVIRKGIIGKYILNGLCIDRFRGGSAIAVLPRELKNPDETLAKYQLTVSSVPPFSTCNFSVAAETKIGRGGSSNCSINTPLACM